VYIDHSLREKCNFNLAYWDHSLGNWKLKIE
jgi:hypothetical protein